MAWCSLLENVASFFSHGGEKNVSRSRKWSFQVETLEEHPATFFIHQGLLSNGYENGTMFDRVPTTRLQPV